MRISDWSSDVCSSDLLSTPSTLRSGLGGALGHLGSQARHHGHRAGEDLPPSCHSRAGPRSLGETQGGQGVTSLPAAPPWARRHRNRSEEHTSELQSLMRISYAVFCLNKKTKDQS